MKRQITMAFAGAVLGMSLASGNSVLAQHRMNHLGRPSAHAANAAPGAVQAAPGGGLQFNPRDVMKQGPGGALAPQQNAPLAGGATGPAAAPGGAALAQGPRGQLPGNQAVAFGGHGQFGGRVRRSPVIDLILRHCYDPRHYLPGPIDRFPAPWGPVGWDAPLFGGQQLGDLELLAVGLVADAGPEHGPIYRVTFRNNSQYPVENFRLSLVAVLGQISHACPVTTVDIAHLDAGATGTAEIELPLAAMQLGSADAAAPFDTLVVSLDSFDEFVERNEANNLASLSRANIQLIEVVAPAEAAPAEAAPTGPAEELTPPTSPALAPTQPGPDEAAPPQPPAIPDDKLSLDNIDLDSIGGVAEQTTGQ